MPSTLLVFKKEIDRFLSNKLTAAMSVFLPGIMIFALWTVMGDVANPAEDDSPVALGVVNLPDSMAGGLDPDAVTVVDAGSAPIDADRVYGEIKDGGYGALVVFPAGFDEGLGAGEVQQVEVYYNSGSAGSVRAYEAATAILDAYESSMANLFDVNAGGGEYDLATKQDKAGVFSVALVPFMLLILVFSSCMSVAAESIAGEKERGTLATLLATPVRRRDIVRGKLLACSLIGLAIALSSAVGIFASLPSVMGDSVDMSVYGPSEYVLTALVVVSLTLLVVVLIMLVSCFAKTTKDAQMLLTPVMLLVMGVGLLGLVGEGAQSATAYYLIPLYSCVESMIGVLTFDFDAVNLAVCIAGNVACAAVGVLVLERLFESERVMFAR